MGAAEKAEPEAEEPEEQIEILDERKQLRSLSGDMRSTIATGARAALCKRKFSAFLREGWLSEEGEEIEWSPQLEGLCDHLQWLFEGWLVANRKANPRQLAAVIAQWQRAGLEFRERELLVQNLNVNMPPGTLKSTVIMVYFPAWIWLHAPAFTFACSCSNDAVWKRDSRAHAKLVQGIWYRRSFDIKWSIAKNSTAIGEWSTTKGGIRISRSILSGFVGLHVDGIFIDDPDDPDRVWNEPARRAVQSKYRKTIENRVKHPMRSIRIICQQRVHSEDLSAFLRRKGTWAANENRAGWAVFCIPMVAGAGPADVPEETPFGWRDPRAKGETLSPERFPASFLAAEKRDKGSHGYNSQYNQNPETLDGGMFSRGWFRFFRLSTHVAADLKARPRGEGMSQEAAEILQVDNHGHLDLDWLSISVDATFGSTDEKKASHVGLLVIGGKSIKRYVFDDKTEALTFVQTCERILELIKLYPARRVLIETKANGPAIIGSLRKAVEEEKVLNKKGKPVAVVVEEFDPGKDSKIARARAMMPDVEAGVLFLLDGAVWLEDFLKEICVFPNAPRDDRMDALSQAMIFYSADNDEHQRAKALARW